MRVADGGFERLHVVWEDPRLEEALYAGSVNGGASWTAPATLGEAEQRPGTPAGAGHAGWRGVALVGGVGVGRLHAVPAAAVGCGRVAGGLE